MDKNQPSVEILREVLVLPLLGVFLAAFLTVPAASQDTEDAPPGAAMDAAWRADARWDEVDEIGTADIHRFTTSAEYLTPLVSYIPEHADVPSPRDVLGYIVGSADELTHPDDEYRYFESLAASSPMRAI